MFSCSVEDVYFPPSRQNECCVICSDLSIRFHVVSSGTRLQFDGDPEEVRACVEQSLICCSLIY